MKDADIKAMNRRDLEDEVMLLRAQVKVLQDWIALAKKDKGTEFTSYTSDGWPTY
jgi:hypothetical protein